VKYLSVCSGIEAASVAWHPLGWAPWAFSEIDPFPCAVLAHHYGSNLPGEPLATNGVPNLGDMTKFREWPDAAIDLLVGGTPCQDYSVAGKRAGMAGERGQLTLTFLEIAARYRPTWIVWENVPGVLSSNKGRDFATFLGDLGQLGYGWSYRVLDAQYVRTCGRPYAVPQRRRRVFVVGYLGDWRPPAAVFLEPEGLRGNPAPRRETGKGLARGFECGPQGGGFTDIAPTLDTRCKDGPIRNQVGAGVICANSGDVGYCLTASAQNSLDAETETETETETLIAVAGQLVPVAFDCKGTEVQFSTDGAHPTLRSMGHNQSHQNAGGHAAVALAIQERAVSTNPATGPQGAGVQEGHAYTLEARNKVQAVAFDLRGRDGGAMPEGPHDTANIRAAEGGSSRSYIAQPWAVRRLTPMECERLQGFPDGYTDAPYRRRNHTPDGPRYKALGNSMAVNAMEYIGRRIALVDAEIAATGFQARGWGE
jgi:DNA (cytosine-5)-methyltransferase 1